MSSCMACSLHPVKLSLCPVVVKAAADYAGYFGRVWGGVIAIKDVNQ